MELQQRLTEGAPERSGLIKTFKNVGLDAKGDILNPRAQDNEVGRDANDVDVAASPTNSKSHDPSVIAKKARLDAKGGTLNLKALGCEVGKKGATMCNLPHNLEEPRPQCYWQSEEVA